MYSVLIVVNIVVAAIMTGLILIQHGKGADAGASFGSGSSGTVFGAAGTGSALTRATAILTAIFFASSLGLVYLSKNQNPLAKIANSSDVPAAVEAPATDVPAASSVNPVINTATPPTNTPVIPVN